MFHHEDKLKDLKVNLTKMRYTIQYKNEKAVFHLKDGSPTKAILTYYQLIRKIRYEDAKYLTIGEKNEERDVWHFSTPNGILPTLRCGVTIHDTYEISGTWSSTPHPFELNPELGFEEVFLYLLSGNYKNIPAKYCSRGAIQTGYGKWENGHDVDEVWQVHDRDISAIPMGYHPVVGEPGVHVSYIWAYLAKKKEWEKI